MVRKTSNITPVLAEKTVSYMFAIAFFVLMIVGFINSIRFSPVNRDAGYYLAMAQRVAEGWVPVKDIYTAYTPFSYYFFAIPQMLFPLNYQATLGFFYLLYLLLGVVYLLILRKIIASQHLRILGVALILTLVYTCLGYGIFLEPFVLVFGALSLLFVMNKRNVSYYLSGIAVFLAFFSKQYGILYLPILMLLTGVQSRGSSRKILCQTGLILLGLLTGLIVALLYYVLLHSVSWDNILPLVYGKSIALAYSDFTHKWKLLLNFSQPLNLGILWMMPLLAIFFQIASKRNWLTVNSVIIAGWFLFCLPLIVGFPYMHYFQLLVPFSVIPVLFHFDKDKSHGNRVFITLVCVISLLSAVKSGSFWLSGIDSEKKVQIATSQLISQYIPDKSEVILLNKPEYNYLGNFLPFLKRTIGYGFITEGRREEIWKPALKDAPYIIVFKENYGVDYKNIKQYLEQEKSLLVTVNGETSEEAEIWVNKR